MLALTYDENDNTLDLTPVECFKCGDVVPVSDTEVLIIQTAKQTHWSPAEYEEEIWCTACRTRAEHEQERDPAYERACANGWED